MRLTILVIFVTFFMVQNTFSQQKNFPNSWSELINQEEVTITHKKIDCGLNSDGMHKEYIMLQITNNTATDINISWNMLTQYTAAKTISLPATENLKTITIRANETVTGGCEQHWNDPLRIFLQSKAPIGPKQKLVDFKLDNLIINTLQ